MSRSAGTWQAKWRDKTAGERRAKALGTADDYEDADGIRIMNWAKAQAMRKHCIGSVPNVVVSCGSLIHGREFILS